MLYYLNGNNMIQCFIGEGKIWSIFYWRFNIITYFLTNESFSDIYRNHRRAISSNTFSGYVTMPTANFKYFPPAIIDSLYDLGNNPAVSLVKPMFTNYFLLFSKPIVIIFGFPAYPLYSSFS